MLRSSVQAIDNHQQRKSCTTIGTPRCGWLLRSFGVLKARFLILNLMSNFKHSRQRYLIIACCGLQNFIRMNNRGDELFRTWAPSWVEGTSRSGLPSHNTKASSSTATQRHVLEMSKVAKRLMTQFRDDINDAMWADYVAR